MSVVPNPEPQDVKFRDNEQDSFATSSAVRKPSVSAAHDSTTSSSLAYVAAKLLVQVKLLCWKRYRETIKNPGDFAKLLVPPMMFFAMMILFYSTFKKLFSDGALEPLFAPLAFWLFGQRLLVQIMNEKHTRVQEAMRMMGLHDIAYWVSYFLFDGVAIGFLMSLVCAIFTVGGLFNDGNFGVLLVLFWIYCMSLTTFVFFLTAFFDTPGTAGQSIFAVLMSCYVLFIVFFVAKTMPQDDVKMYDDVWKETQIWCCLLPPLAFQIGAGSFLKSYKGIGVWSAIGMMVLDMVIYTVLAWYFSQVWPSKVGVSKPFYFFLEPSYWGLGVTATHAKLPLFTTSAAMAEPHSNAFQTTDESLTGEATVVVDRLKKTFASGTSYQQIAVNDLSFKLYENQIFALLGHNGAGKTTTISMLTGLTRPDLSMDGRDCMVYGHSMQHNMDRIRGSMGVCPQHDVLFDNLSVGEHILFFSQLKGYTYDQAEAEATSLSTMFHLEHRLDHLGSELSGGQKRKLSVAIAVCGGSKFVVLDEPTAGMDPLARRELWDLLASLRHGRTVLLTTHYMDEADVLGDRVGIMSLGQMQCVGTTQFLKTTFGNGYKLSFDKQERSDSSFNLQSLDKAKMDEEASALVKLEGVVRGYVPDATVLNEPGAESQVQFLLPFSAVKQFGALFTAFDEPGMLQKFNVANVGLTITSLEDVFLRVGGDHSVTHMSAPASRDAIPTESKMIRYDNGQKDAEGNDNGGGGGGDASGNGNEFGLSIPTSQSTTTTTKSDERRFLGKYRSSRAVEERFVTQVIGIMFRRLRYAFNDITTLFLLILPIGAVCFNAYVYKSHLITPADMFNDLAINGIFLGAYIVVPGLLAEFLVRERSERLRNLLTVMGCNLGAYWLGTYLADLLLMAIPLVSMWITWGVADMTNFSHVKSGLCFLWTFMFTAEIIAFAYVFSLCFTSPKATIAIMPMIAIMSIVVPNVVFLIVIEVVNRAGGSFPENSEGGMLLWAMTLCSPFGAEYALMIQTLHNYDWFLNSLPPTEVVVIIMCLEIFLFIAAAYYMDLQSVIPLPQLCDDGFDPAVLLLLDRDILQERKRVLGKNDPNPSAGKQDFGLTEQPSIGLEGRVSEVMVMGTGPILEPDKEADAARDPLQVMRLRKRFPPKVAGRPSVVAVQDVAFAVKPGECFGLLGANGAGKSTTLSMLTRHLVPSSGTAYVEGSSILGDFPSAAQHIGLVTQNNSLWDRLSVEDHLSLFGHIRGIPHKDVQKVVDDIIAQLELEPHRKKLAMRLSGGMKRKLCVAIALVGNPKVVLLDEPSAGLDPVSRHNLWSVILKTMQGRSVILTTHSMEEAEALCHRIGIMVHGQMRVLGTKQHLKNRYGLGFELAIKLVNTKQRKASSPEAEAVTANAAQLQITSPTDAGEKSGKESEEMSLGISGFKMQVRRLTEFVQSKVAAGATIVTENAGMVTYRIPREEMKMGVLFAQLQQGKEALGVEDYSVSQPTLEQVFIRTIHDNPFVQPELTAADKVVAEVNKCGCTDFTVRIGIALFTALFIVFFFLQWVLYDSSAVVSVTMFFLFWIFFITSCVFCNMLCWPCCKNPKGDE